MCHECMYTHLQEKSDLLIGMNLLKSQPNLQETGWKALVHQLIMCLLLQIPHWRVDGISTSSNFVTRHLSSTTMAHLWYAILCHHKSSVPIRVVASVEFRVTAWRVISSDKILHSNDLGMGSIWLHTRQSAMTTHKVLTATEPCSSVMSIQEQNTPFKPTVSDWLVHLGDMTVFMDK